jgi:hypothetical protein
MIDAAASGSTVRLGHLLAPAGVRYIAFVRRAAPSSGAFGRDETRLNDALARQLDLTLSRIDDSGVVYDNDAWVPMRALVSPGRTGVPVDGRDPQAAAIRSEADGVFGVTATAGTTSATGPGTLLWSESANPRWVATVNGRRVARRDAFGWTNAFALDSNAPVHVHYSGTRAVSVARYAEIAIWIGTAALWFATRRRRDVSRAVKPAPVESGAGT